jgi:hypothetical protein
LIGPRGVVIQRPFVARFFFYAALRALVCEEIGRNAIVVRDEDNVLADVLPASVFPRYSPLFSPIRCLLLSAFSLPGVHTS